MRLLIKNNFFKEPRSLAEVIQELERENYHHVKSSIASALGRDFVKKQKILTRIKKGKIDSNASFF